MAAISCSVRAGRPGTRTSETLHIGPSLTSFSVCRSVSPMLVNTIAAAAVCGSDWRKAARWRTATTAFGIGTAATASNFIYNFILNSF